MTDSVFAEIVKVLKTDTDPKSFCKEADLAVDKISIKVTGVGTINFPLTEDQIKKLIKVSTKAKFGKKEQTVLDETVRNTQVIDRSKLDIEIDNETMTSMLKKMKKSMGLQENSTLVPHLHNMLVYGPGQFFDFHQDTEKLDGMIATLVIILPYPHIGGTLVIKNKMNSDKKAEIKSQTIGAELKKAKCIAFYADCLHKIEKVTEGYRVALTYNLVLQSKGQVTFKNNTFHQKLRSLVEEYFSLPDISSTQKLAYFLEHQYTEKNLKWDKLKGPDQSVVTAFRYIAKELDLIIYLALVEISEHYAIYEDEGHGKNYKYTRVSDDESGKYIKLTYLLKTDNTKATIGDCILEEDEVFSIKGIDKMKPYKQSRDHTGNEGGEIEKWYRCTAVVLWPKAKEVANQFKMNYKKNFNKLLSLISEPGNEEEALNLVTEAEEVLTKDLEEEGYSEGEKVHNFLKISLYIQNKELAKSLLKKVELRKAMKVDNAEIIRKLEIQYGTEWLISLLNKWRKKSSHIYSSNFEKINSFLTKFLELEGSMSFTEIVLDMMCSAIIENDKNSTRCSWNKTQKFDAEKITNLNQFLAVIVKVQNTNLLKKIIEHVLSEPVYYPVINVSEIFFKYKKIVSSDYFRNFIPLKDSLLERVNSHLPRLINDLDDWSVNNSVYCSCEYCKVLKEFLNSKKNKNISLRTNDIEKGSSHLSQIIRNSSLPIDINQERAGMSYKIILTKKDSMHDKLREKLQRFKVIRSELLKI